MLAPVAAVARPLPWIAAVFLVAAWFTAKDPSPPPADAERGPQPGPARWEIAALPVLWWGLATSRPFGPGLVPQDALDLVAHFFSDRPLVADGAAVLLPLAAIPLLAGPAMRGAASILGGVVGSLVLVATFGSDQAWLSAAVLGAVVGAYPPQLPRDARGRSRVLLYALVVCACASGRLALTERWRCADVAEEAPVKTLLEARDVHGIALSAGNLGYLALLADEGASLRRMTVTGALGDSIALDPPGGLLVSPLEPGGLVTRVVPQEEGALIERWDVPRLLMESAETVELGCRPDRALDEGAHLLLGCGERTVRVTGVATQPLDLPGTPREVLSGGLLTLGPGPLAQAQVVSPVGAVATSGPVPWAADVASSPGRFLIARGPTGHLELRGPPVPVPTLHASASDPEARVRETLAGRADTVRVGVWPGAVHYSPKRRAAYVSSPIDASVTLVDLDVTWHQRAVSVGAPPRQVVLESGSATLYVANRCGVFAVRVPRPDPWE
ncbi:MAG: hypothetical protein KDA24_00565 [Deltaproteobacteria bacterium]|nr:hypothetical protein [Deltaproteobacteria bacterium]